MGTISGQLPTFYILSYIHMYKDRNSFSTQKSDHRKGNFKLSTWNKFLKV